MKPDTRSWPPHTNTIGKDWRNIRSDECKNNMNRLDLSRDMNYIDHYWLHINDALEIDVIDIILSPH
jgi:hypothetical protein